MKLLNTVNLRQLYFACYVFQKTNPWKEKKTPPPKLQEIEVRGTALDGALLYHNDYAIMRFIFKNSFIH